MGFEEGTMTFLERLTGRITSRIGLIVAFAMLVLAVSSTAGRDALDARVTVIATAAAQERTLQVPPGLLGIHSNMAATVPANISKALAFGEAAPANLTAEERNAGNQLDFFYKRGREQSVPDRARSWSSIQAARQPKLFSEELRTAYRSLRQQKGSP
jgi:hypothetical protein